MLTFFIITILNMKFNIDQLTKRVICSNDRMLMKTLLKHFNQLNKHRKVEPLTITIDDKRYILKNELPSDVMFDLLIVNVNLKKMLKDDNYVVMLIDNGKMFVSTKTQRNLTLCNRVNELFDRNRVKRDWLFTDGKNLYIDQVIEKEHRDPVTYTDILYDENYVTSLMITGNIVPNKELDVTVDEIINGSDKVWDKYKSSLIFVPSNCHNITLYDWYYKTRHYVKPTQDETIKLFDKVFPKADRLKSTKPNN